MTAKNKADELISKFYSILFNSDSDKGEEILISGLSEQCAVVAVEEILNAIDWHEFETPNNFIEFWQEVKSEILNSK